MGSKDYVQEVGRRDYVQEVGRRDYVQKVGRLFGNPSTTCSSKVMSKHRTAYISSVSGM